MSESDNKRQAIDSARRKSPLDTLISGFDRALRTVGGGNAAPRRPSPAKARGTATLDADQRRHVSGLMRVNHTGEVCAQALYQGQALTAKDAVVRDKMASSAQEEEDHLAWCEERLKQLGSRPSVLNPVFYGLSFGLGALAGMAGDRWSLGFVAATEEQVCKHLQSHLQRLPVQDQQSAAIIRQMLDDEAQHASKAIDAGATEFNAPAKALMTAISKVMTETTYRI